MSVARYGEVLVRAVGRDFLPRFKRVGIDAGPAFAHAKLLRG